MCLTYRFVFETHLVGGFGARQGPKDVTRKSHFTWVTFDGPTMRFGQRLDEVLSQLACGVEILVEESALFARKRFRKSYLAMGMRFGISDGLGF